MMRYRHIAAILAGFALAACASDQPAEPRQHSAAVGRVQKKSEEHEEIEPKEKAPKVGMSKSQVRSMYGDPDSISHSARGEIWHYWFNKGHAFIPYNFGYHARMGTFTFNANGVLTDFNYNE
jgi:outer membrane protein assembly factor BamE (lipoprotein component of BamABCDE complex)